MPATYAVTGVAGGIGAEICKALKAAGHDVIGFDVRPTSAHVDHFIALDLDDPASIEAAAAAVPRPLDGLCNNAGLPPRPGLEAKILRVNFLGQRALTGALLPHLKEGASVVNMASRAGAGWRANLDRIKRLAALTDGAAVADFITREGLDATRCYTLSKEAVIVWTLAMTEELIDRGMRINSISPGAVATGILDDFATAFGEVMVRNVARAGRPGRPGEIAAVAAFLLSPGSHWLKGADIPIDGGMGAFNLADQLDLAVLKG